MKTSFIIPVYKTPPELFAACMESVLAWSGEGVEFILIIDSPGHAIEKDVYAYAEKDCRVRVLRNTENRGPSYSRNLGIDAAKGDYVMMVDADDCIVPSVCQKALDYCREKHLAYCAVARVYPWQTDGVDCFETHQLYTGSFKNADKGQLAEVLPRLDMSSSGVWFDRDFLNEHHLRYPEDLRQNEDFVFTTGVLATRASVGIWDEYGYAVTWHADSLSQNRQKATFHAHQLAAAQRIIQLIGSSGLPRGILHFYANHAYNQIFAPWHLVSFESAAKKSAAIRDLGSAAKSYLACYAACLRLLAKLVIAYVSRFPGTMFRRPPLINYIFRALRKFGWYFKDVSNSSLRLGLSTSTSPLNLNLKPQPKPIYIYLTPCFPSPESWRGGFCYDAVKALMRDGRYDVRVMTSSPGADYDYHGIHVYRFHKFAIGCSDYLPFITNPLKIYYFAKKLKAMGLKPSDIAVCHVHLFENYAPYATWLKRKNPRCLTLLHHHWTGNHGLSVGKYFSWIPGLKPWLYLYTRKHLEAADAHICCSQKTADAFGRWFPHGQLMPSEDMKNQIKFARFYRSVEPKCVKVVYNGIDTKIFHPSAENRNGNQFVIGCVANFIPEKSQITLIKAFALVHDEMSNAVLKLVGSGICLDSCKQYVKDHDLQDKVEFIQELHHDDMPSFYQQLNLYVLPTYYAEAFNCSYIEAWGCGVPIIGCKGISIDEVLSKIDADKWLVAPKDEKRLSEMLIQAYRERPSRQQLTRNLDINVVTNNFLNWIDSKINTINS